MRITPLHLSLLLAAAILVPRSATAKSSGFCDDVQGTPRGICQAFCGAQQCHLQEELDNSCARLMDNWARKRSDALPCLCAGPSGITLAENVEVPGRSNPWLAMTEPDQWKLCSPGSRHDRPCWDGVEPQCFPIPAGITELEIHASGRATNLNRWLSTDQSPDGRWDSLHCSAPWQNPDVPIGPWCMPPGALLGVFLTPASRPPAIDYGSFSDGSACAALAVPQTPLLGQTFFVGDGKKGHSATPSLCAPTDERMRFVVPDGAAELCLGIVDVFEWKNNLGVITVDLAAGFCPAD